MAKSEQSKKFVAAAKELETDNDEHTFDSNLKKLASAPPPESVEARKKPKPKKSDE